MTFQSNRWPAVAITALLALAPGCAEKAPTPPEDILSYEMITPEIDAEMKANELKEKKLKEK